MIEYVIHIVELKIALDARFSECNHIAASYDLVAMFDAVNNVDPFQDEDGC